MITITNIDTYGWEAAIRGMRNSRQSWEKSDSMLLPRASNPNIQIFFVGEKDLELASNLASLGSSHAKFRRMIYASMDICAPLYWWKEFDTYKVGTVTNSTSTMYSIMNKEFSLDDFSQGQTMDPIAGTLLLYTVNALNNLRDRYLNADNPTWKRMYWYDVIRALPSSYNQLRTVSLNYEVLSHICHERLYHKLDEWQEFCRIILANLPYAKELIFKGENNGKEDQN